MSATNATRPRLRPGPGGDPVSRTRPGTPGAGSKRTGAACLLWAGICGGLAPAAVPAEEPSSEPLVISRETCSGLFLVPLTWTSESSGRTHDLLAVFDTGGSRALIDPDALERASGTRVAAGRRVRMSNVAVAGKAFSKFRPRVKDMDHLGRALGRTFDVFLPFQTFDEYLLTIDYPRGEMRIRRGSLPPPDGVEIFSSRGRDARPWLEVAIGSVRRRLLIDSGSTGTIGLGATYGLGWKGAALPLRFSHGMDDVELSEVGRLDGSITLGRLVFEEPVVRMTTDTELIGEEVLRNFVITFDPKNHRVRLQPAVEGPVRLRERRGTGAVFRAGPDGYEIVHVVKGSPADRAELVPGELVTRIDGVSVFDRGCRGREGGTASTQTFTVVRDGRSREVTVDIEVLVP